MSLHAPGLPLVNKRKKKPKKWLRTRDREHLQMLNLQLDVNSLYSEIQALQVTRALLFARTMNRRDTQDGSYVRMVHEYFHKMRHGYSEAQDQLAMVQARQFLYSMLDADVVKGHLRGIAACIRSIAVYTEAFGPVVHELVSAMVQVNPNADSDDRLSGNGTVLVQARTRYQATIVPKTFAIIFPLAPQDLRDRLVGKELDGYGQFDVVFDTVTHRVLRFDIQFDFLPAFSKVLPRPADLARLFSGALVATDCTIGDEATTDPLPVVEELTSDEDVSSVASPSSSVASPTPSRSMDIHSILNDDDDDCMYA